MLEKMRNPGEGYEAKSPESGLHTFGAERRRNILAGWPHPTTNPCERRLNLRSALLQDRTVGRQYE